MIRVLSGWLFLRCLAPQPIQSVTRRRCSALSLLGLYFGDSNAGGHLCVGGPRDCQPFGRCYPRMDSCTGEDIICRCQLLSVLSVNPKRLFTRCLNCLCKRSTASVNTRLGGLGCHIAARAAVPEKDLVGKPNCAWYCLYCIGLSPLITKAILITDIKYGKRG